MALIAGVVGGAVVVALLCAGAIVVWLRRGGKSVAKIAPHSHGVINPPGEWDFFLSHTQRDGAATMLCELLFNSFKEMGFTVWLDVRMDKRDMAAMEEGAKNCKCFLAIVTDNGADSYFSREMCRKEIRWAQEAERKIVPVCSQADKGRIGQFIQESLVQEVDFSAYNFVVRPSPAPPAPQCEVARASLLIVRTSGHPRRTSTARLRVGSRPRSRTSSTRRACPRVPRRREALASLSVRGGPPPPKRFPRPRSRRLSAAARREPRRSAAGARRRDGDLAAHGE